MKADIRLIIIALLPSVLLAAGLYDVFEPCCLEGVRWSRDSYRCDNYPAPVYNISDVDQAACLSIIEVCCIKQTQMGSCEAGKQTALIGDVCAIRDLDPGAEQFRECCHCCQLGLVSRGQNPGMCQSPKLGEPCDSKYKECCMDQPTGNVTFNGGVSSRNARHSDPDILINDSADPVVPVAPREATDDHILISDTSIPSEADEDTGSSDPSILSEADVEDNSGAGGEDVLPSDSSDGGSQVTREGDSDTWSKNHDEWATSDGSDHVEDEKVNNGQEEEEEKVTPPFEEEEKIEPDESEANSTVKDSEEDTGSDEDITEDKGGEEDLTEDKGDEEDITEDKGDEEDLTEDKSSEEDYMLNECSLFAGQLCSHSCVDTVGGFYCSCPEGMILDTVDNRTCLVDTDLGERSCDENNPCEQRCLNPEEGGVECRCYDGYRLAEDLVSCEDIDECLEGVAKCAPGQRCVNTRGRFTCMSSRCPMGYEHNSHTGQCEPGAPEVCEVGFAYNDVTSNCEDLNECGLGIDHCRAGERCENTIGSYACRRVRHCGTGYTLDEESQKCIDNNECILGTHNCDAEAGYECQNTRGSFRCVPITCPKDYRFDSSVGKCVLVECDPGLRPNEVGGCEDINECEEYGPTTCKRHQKCVNTRGSYYCQNFVNCPPGYEPTDNSGCQDINECERGEHMCSEEQQCVNRQGSYFCQCPRGMRYDHTGRCVDVDECAYGAAICPSNSKCTNTVGSFKCECIDGLVSTYNDTCTDIDECEQEGVCQQNCVNVLGTFFCSCNRGYQLRDDKRSCEDIDECTQFGGGPGRSSVCGGRCVNMPGSYRCECPAGWRLKPDGRSCQDVNECSEGSAFCPNPDSVCINTRGGYKCPVVRCPEGFMRINSSRQQNSFRCKRVSVDCPECRRGLRSRTYNFLSFASNVLVPAPLFSMSGSRLRTKSYNWGLDLVSARPLSGGISKATRDDFRLNRSREFARVTLLNRIDGPQDVVLMLTMNVTSYRRGYEGSAESRIYLYITEEDFNL